MRIFFFCSQIARKIRIRTRYVWIFVDKFGRKLRVLMSFFSPICRQISWKIHIRIRNLSKKVDKLLILIICFIVYESQIARPDEKFLLLSSFFDEFFCSHIKLSTNTHIKYTKKIQKKKSHIGTRKLSADSQCQMSTNTQSLCM